MIDTLCDTEMLKEKNEDMLLSWEKFKLLPVTKNCGLIVFQGFEDQGLLKACMGLPAEILNAKPKNNIYEDT